MASEGCGSGLCRCLASIPCSVLCLFLVSFGAVLACGGSLVVAFYRTRIVVNVTDSWPWFMYICLGVGLGMLLLIAVFLAVATLSTKHTAARLFCGSRRRLRCIRAFNCVAIALMLLLQFVWLIITVALSIIVLDILLIDNVGAKAPRCIHLAHYGIPRQPRPQVCNEEIQPFLESIQKEELLICYLVSLASSVVMVISLTLFMINAASNYAHLGQIQSKGNSTNSGGGSRSNDVMTSGGHGPIGGGYPSYDGPRMMATETAM